MGMRNYTWSYVFFMNWVFWYLFPTVQLKLKWPVGEVVVEPGAPGWDWAMGATKQLVMSADPNDHYRPWLEKHVGKQAWAWDWKMAENDVADNRLTLRIRRDKAKYATLAAVRWA
jgi:hypothetical protein